jgi:hypothetical protein
VDGRLGNVLGEPEPLRLLGTIGIYLAFTRLLGIVLPAGVLPL